MVPYPWRKNASTRSPNPICQTVNLVKSFSRSPKEINDLDIFDAGVKSIFDFGQEDLMPHFIYCGDYYFFNERIEKLREMLLAKMRKYGIQSSILTMLCMARWNLVTKEKAKKAAEGKLKNDEEWKDYEGSINDDLERFFTNLQNQEEEYEYVLSFFTPKLTNEELKLVQVGNKEHLKTYLDYYFGVNPDVNVEEMKKSDSKSKYVNGRCERVTLPLNLETTANDDELEDIKKK